MCKPIREHNSRANDYIELIGEARVNCGQTLEELNTFLFVSGFQECPTAKCTPGFCKPIKDAFKNALKKKSLVKDGTKYEFDFLFDADDVLTIHTKSHYIAADNRSYISLNLSISETDAGEKFVNVGNMTAGGTRRLR